MITFYSRYLRLPLLTVGTVVSGGRKSDGKGTERDREKEVIWIVGNEARMRMTKRNEWLKETKEESG